MGDITVEHLIIFGAQHVGDGLLVNGQRKGAAHSDVLEIVGAGFAGVHDNKVGGSVLNDTQVVGALVFVGRAGGDAERHVELAALKVHGLRILVGHAPEGDGIHGDGVLVEIGLALGEDSLLGRVDFAEDIGARSGIAGLEGPQRVVLRGVLRKGNPGSVAHQAGQEGAGGLQLDDKRFVVGRLDADIAVVFHRAVKVASRFDGRLVILLGALEIIEDFLDGICIVDAVGQRTQHGILEIMGGEGGAVAPHGIVNQGEGVGQAVVADGVVLTQLLLDIPLLVLAEHAGIQMGEDIFVLGLGVDAVVQRGDMGTKGDINAAR